MEVVKIDPRVNENKNELINISFDIEKIMNDLGEEDYVVDIFRRYANISRRFIQSEKIDQTKLKRELDNLKLELWKNAANKKYENLNVENILHKIKCLISKDFREKTKEVNKLIGRVQESGSGYDKEDYVEKYQELYRLTKELNQMKIDPQTLALIVAIIGLVLLILLNWDKILILF